MPLEERGLHLKQRASPGAASEVPSRSDSEMAGRLLSLFKGLRGKKSKGPAAAPAQQPAEPEQLEPLQDDASKDGTQEQELTRGRFRRVAQALRRFLRLRRRKTSGRTTEGTAEPDSRPSELQAEDASSTASSDFMDTSEEETSEDRAEADMALTEGMAATNTCLEAIPETEAMPMLRVQAVVRNILQRLTSCSTVDAELQMIILSLTEEHPAQVVMSLLRCAPLCDRAAELMWRAIGTSEVAVEEVLPALLSALEELPPYGGFVCSGDNEAVFALAATLVLRRIASMPEWRYAILIHSPHLFVALLLQVFITTEQRPEEVESLSFWRACQEEDGLCRAPNRFAVQTIEALLSQRGFGKKLVALEHKQLWDSLLCANSPHCAAGLLAREMRCALTPLCPHMASHLLSLLIGKQPRCDLPALAIFVELLECLDLRIHGPSALLVVSRHLPSECRDRLRLALRGLVVLSKEPSLGGGIRGLYPQLVEQLADADAEVVEMTLSVLTHTLQDTDLQIASITALKLAESLLPHFEDDNSHVQQLSIQLFSKVMELIVEERENPLTTIVSQSLLPLFLRWHDENLQVAKACGEALLPEEEGSRGAAGEEAADEVRRAPASAGREPSGRAPGLGPAAPAEPTEAPTRGGRQVHRGGRSAHAGAEGGAPSPQGGSSSPEGR